jgi:hypothetical protein
VKKSKVIALVALVALVALAVALIRVSLGRSSTHFVPVDHPCTNVPQPAAGSYTYSVPPTNPTPVDPIVAVPAPGGGSFAELVTQDGVTTQQKFVPRGADYVRLTTVTEGPNTICVISNFDVGTGPDAYNPHRAAQALAAMEGYGYNVVHVSFNPLQSGEMSGRLNPAYWANVTNFINLARTDNIRVSMDLMPLPVHQIPKPSTVPLPESDQRRNGNLYYLEPAYLTAEENYVSDLIDLKTDQANLSDIFAFELQGETYFKTDLWPLDLTSGMVSTNAGTFDMANATSRDAMIDSNTLYWENHLADVIHSAVPNSLVSVGFTQGLVAFPQDRIGRPQSSLSPSSLVDYVDFHLYPRFGPIYTQISSIGVAADTVTKPIIIGEFGEYESEAPNNTPAAADALATWEKQSCDLYGFRFSGWITWTWDTQPWEQHPTIYNMSQDHYAIAKALSPQSLDPLMSTCQ